MTKLEILKAPHPVLKKVAEPVEKIDDDLRILMDDMLETMYHDIGIGLAAPQVGVSKRVIVIDIQEEDSKPLKLVNPEIIWSSEQENIYREGCLSFPEQFAEVSRPDRVKLCYLDENGAQQEIEADGLLGICIQHEIDHLNGVLFVDHLGAMRRNLIMKKMRKLKNSS